jgi:flagellar protein FliO/FliZ
MKAIGRVLLFTVLILAPAYGRTVSNTAKNDSTASAPTNEETIVPAGPTQAQPVVDVPAEEFRFPMMQTVGGLLLVLALIAAAFFGAKKFFPQFFVKCGAEKNLQIIETLPMGDRRSIALVQFADRQFLVGSTPHQINLLSTLQESIPLISQADSMKTQSKGSGKKGNRSPFRNLFEIEKNRSTQYTGNPLPEDVRNKMRQLREALER